MEPAVEFRDVSFGIGARDILRGLNLRIESGQRLVLLGRSGSGKTTALRLINGLLRPSAGDVLVQGRSTAAWNVTLLRRGIGYAIQDTGLFPHWTVAANVGLVPRLNGWPPPSIEERTRELLTATGLEPSLYLERYPRELSGGQRQRVGVARALAGRPSLLLFDEPFGAVDPITRLDLQQMLLDICDRTEQTVLFVTHDLAEALTVGTHIGLLATGELVWHGQASAFRSATHPEAAAFLACLRS